MGWRRERERERERNRGHSCSGSGVAGKRMEVDGGGEEGWGRCESHDNSRRDHLGFFMSLLLILLGQK